MVCSFWFYEVEIFEVIEIPVSKNHYSDRHASSINGEEGA